jgi:EAL domain-containing protein (putative c-di-GMP-specific phosphodiesterase class I)
VYQPAVLRSELKPAMAAGAIVPYYQPVIRLSDGQVAGFEILARWKHPRRGSCRRGISLPLPRMPG